MNKLKTLLILTLVAGCGDGLNPAPNGEACELAEDCENEVCLIQLGEEDAGNTIIKFPDGLCSVECDLETGDGCILETEICLVYNATNQQNCYQRCVGHDDCREGYFCTPTSFFDLGRACLPPF